MHDLTPTQTTGGQNYLLTIAIDEYEHFNTLNNAVKDIEEITDILVKLYQFKPDNVHRLVNDEATEDGIDEKFLELVDLVKEEDNLVVFFSGHGYYRENVEEGYWVPVDGRKDKVSDYISNSNLITYLQKIKAHHLLLIVDSCFSGSLVEPRGNMNNEHYPSRRVFASGRTELVSDGIPGENSPFAKGIIDFLKANKEQKISTSAMIDAVRTYVNRVTGQRPVEGRISKSKDNWGEFYFDRKLLEEDLWKEALAKGTLDAFEGFLRIFPTGDFSAQAYQELEKQRTLLAWHRAEENNTIFDYEDFVIMHPHSDLVSRAEAKIALIKQHEEVRMRTEEDRMRRIEQEQQQEEELLELTREYREKYLEAQEAIKTGAYRKARNLLYECEKLFREKEERFIPPIDSVKQKREECTRQLIFEEYAEDGKRSFRTKDYRTAIKFFEEALSLRADDEITKLRNAAQLLVNARSIKVGTAGEKSSDEPQDSPVSPTATVTPKPEPAKGKSRIVVSPTNPAEQPEAEPQTRGNTTAVSPPNEEAKTPPRRSITVAAGAGQGRPQDTRPTRVGVQQPHLRAEATSPPASEPDRTWLYVALLFAAWMIALKLLVY